MQVYTWPPRNNRYKLFLCYGVIALIIVATAIALVVILVQNSHKNGSETGNGSNHESSYTTTKPTPPKFTDELRIFFGYIINPNDTDSVDTLNFKNSKTVDYLTDCQSWKFNKINVTFVTTFGTLHTCNNISDCLDYVEHKLDNDTEAAYQNSIKTGQNSTQLLQEFYNFFYVNPTQNISMAYLMTDIDSGDGECNNWHKNPDLDWILKNEDDFTNMFVGQEIYTKFLRIITDLRVTPDCQLIHLINFSRTDLFQELLIDPLMEAIFEDHGFDEITRHSLCLELPDHYNQICKQVGKNASTSNAPTSLSHCKTWYTIVGFLLEANATTDEDVKQLQDFITSITAPCNDQIQGQIEFLAPNYDFMNNYTIPCSLNKNGCAQNISHLTKDQMTFVTVDDIRTFGIMMGLALADNREAIIAADAVVLYLFGKLSSYDNSTDIMSQLIEAINTYGYGVFSYFKEVEIIVRFIVLDVPQGQNLTYIVPSYLFDIGDGWDSLILVPHGENLTSYVDQLTVCV
uniref:Uncharacterized protein n=1 Tax=Acrobeloides nanus TaxID=290746 RepID=A0A914E5Q2_9BILA